MNVAVRCDQHSVRFGHLALSQTVSNRRSSMIRLVADISAVGIGRFSQVGRRRRGAVGIALATSRVAELESVPADTTGNSSMQADLLRRSLEQRMTGVDMVPHVTELLRHVTQSAFANMRH
jgi:hypothetical protein